MFKCPIRIFTSLNEVVRLKVIAYSGSKSDTMSSFDSDDLLGFQECTLSQILQSPGRALTVQLTNQGGLVHIQAHFVEESVIGSSLSFNLGFQQLKKKSRLSKNFTPMSTYIVLSKIFPESSPVEFYKSSVLKSTTFPEWEINLDLDRAVGGNLGMPILIELIEDGVSKEKGRLLSSFITTLGTLGDTLGPAQTETGSVLKFKFYSNSNGFNPENSQLQVGGEEKENEEPHDESNPYDIEELFISQHGKDAMQEGKKVKQSTFFSFFFTPVSKPRSSITSNKSDKDISQQTIPEHSSSLLPSIIIKNSNLNLMPVFSDLLAAGLHTSLNLSIDFSSSNKSFASPDSLHFSGGGPSQYENGIRVLYEVFQEDFKLKKNASINVSGFGALPSRDSHGSGDGISSPVSSVSPHHPRRMSIKPPIAPGSNRCDRIFFPLTLNENKLEISGGIDSVMDQYKSTKSIVIPKEPTVVAPTLRHFAAKILKDVEYHGRAKLRFHIVVIATDGAVGDISDTTAVLKEFSYLPWAIVFLGIGKGVAPHGFQGLKAIEAIPLVACSFSNGISNSAAAPTQGMILQPSDYSADVSSSSLWRQGQTIAKFINYKESVTSEAIRSSLMLWLKMQVLMYVSTNNIPVSRVKDSVAHKDGVVVMESSIMKKLEEDGDENILIEGEMGNQGGCRFLCW